MRRAAVQRRKRKVPSDNSAAERGRSRAVLLEFDFEAAILHFDVNAAFGEGVVDGTFEGFVVADFEDGLECGGEIGSVVVQYRGKGADLRDAYQAMRYRFGIRRKTASLESIRARPTFQERVAGRRCWSACYRQR